MTAKRIIPCLDVRDGRVVKGVQFRNHKDLGDPLELALRHRDGGADELVFYDITASPEQRSVDLKWITRISDHIDIPFSVAGGIQSVELALRVLEAGADKVSINSPALNRPDLINELAHHCGQQCVVIGIDSLQQHGQWQVFKFTGSESTTRHSGIETLEWVKEVQRRGAGEIVLNTMASDGVKNGYDLQQLQAVREVCTVPLIASGGAGNAQHFIDVFAQCDVDGALAASIFHQGMLTPNCIKSSCMDAGIEVRPS